MILDRPVPYYRVNSCDTDTIERITFTMSDGNRPHSMDGPVVLRLVKETGVTLEQARELVSLLGHGNWSSLVREARLLIRSGGFLRH
jgi:hypothetical protein